MGEFGLSLLREPLKLLYTTEIEFSQSFQNFSLHTWFDILALLT